MPRSSWGLSAPSDPWQARARCAEPDVDPDWWTSPLTTDLGRAVHECRRHCAVMQQCAADAARHPGWVAGTVRAGFFYGRQHQPVEQPGPCCRRHSWPPEPVLVGALVHHCVVCGRPFGTYFVRSSYCSPQCRRLRRNEHQRELRSDLAGVR